MTKVARITGAASEQNDKSKGLLLFCNRPLSVQADMSGGIPLAAEGP